MSADVMSLKEDTGNKQQCGDSINTSQLHEFSLLIQQCTVAIVLTASYLGSWTPSGSASVVHQHMSCCLCYTPSNNSINTRQLGRVEHAM